MELLKKELELINNKNMIAAINSTIADSFDSIFCPSSESNNGSVEEEESTIDNIDDSTIDLINKLDNSTEQTKESIYESVSEPSSGSSTEPITGSLNEPIIESSTEPSTELSNEPSTESLNGPANEPPKLENDIYCVVCYNPQNKVNKKYVLNCNHEICTSCITQNIIFSWNSIVHNNIIKLDNDTFIITCPSCNQESNVELNKIITMFHDTNQLNEFFKNMAYKKQYKNVLCANCEAVNATHGCFECDVQLCDECWTIIHKIGKLLQHKKVTLLDYEYNPVCSIHPEYFRKFIDISENKSLCLMCERDDKTKHELISDVALKYRNILENNLCEVNRINESVCDTLIHLNGYSSAQVDELKNKAYRQVNEYFGDIRRKLAMCELSVIEKIKQLMDNQVNCLLQQREELCEYLIKSKEIYQKVNEQITDGSDFLVTLNYTDQLNKLKEIQSNEVNLEKTVINAINVSVSYVDNFNMININMD